MRSQSSNVLKQHMVREKKCGGWLGLLSELQVESRPWYSLWDLETEQRKVFFFFINKNCIYLGCPACWFETRAHSEMVTTAKLVGTSGSHGDHCVWSENLGSTPWANFQDVTQCYHLQSPCWTVVSGLLTLRPCSFVPVTSSCPPAPPSGPWSPPSTLCFYVLDVCRFQV